MNYTHTHKKLIVRNLNRNTDTRLKKDAIKNTRARLFIAQIRQSQGSSNSQKNTRTFKIQKELKQETKYICDNKRAFEKQREYCAFIIAKRLFKW